jgi:chromosome segregation ATPase
MELSRQLDKMDAAELRNLTATLLLAQLADRDAQLADLDAECSAHAALIAKRDAEIKAKQLKIDQLTHEMAILKRYRFDRRSEQMDPVQRSLLDESIDADIEAISLEIEALKEKPAAPPKEKPLDDGELPIDNNHIEATGSSQDPYVPANAPRRS